MKILNDFNVFIFDLDRTIWDTTSKDENKIWAKQMLQPYSLNDDTITDDVFSVCKLHHGIKQFLQLLSDNDKKIGFISRGAVFSTPYEQQPSVMLLKKFGIYDLFNYKKILIYKTGDKAEHLQEIINEVKSCVFFDDMDRDLKSASTINGVVAIDRNSFNNWSTLNEL